jgi:hypothetical protein
LIRFTNVHTIIKRATFLALQDVFRISLRSILVLVFLACSRRLNPPEGKEGLDALDDEQLHLENPDYDPSKPWHNANNADYDDIEHDEDTGAS